jgi:hypothetical protein
MSNFFAYRASWWWASVKLGPFRFAYSLRELNRRYVEIGFARLLFRAETYRAEWGRVFSFDWTWFRKETA